MTYILNSPQTAGADKGTPNFRRILRHIGLLSPSFLRSALLAGTAIAMVVFPLCPGTALQAQAGDFTITNLIIGNVYGNSTDANDPQSNFDGALQGNSITVMGLGGIAGTTYGAYSTQADVALENNSVTFSGEDTRSGNVYGAWTDGAGSFTKSLSGEGGLVKTGSGVLTLDNGGTSIGSVSVKSGALSLQSELTTTKLELFGGTTFAANGYFTPVSDSTLTIQANGSSAIWDGNLMTNGAAVTFSGSSANLLASDTSNPLLLVNGAANLTNSSVEISVDGAMQMSKGDEIVLLKSGGVLTTDNASGDISQGAGVINAGVTLEYGVDLSTDTANNSLTATVTHKSVTKESKALSEGTAAGVALINQGMDLVASDGLKEAQRAANRTGAGVSGASFGVVSGGSSHFKTGSHVDVAGASLMTGVAGDAYFSAGRLLLGAFGEFGRSTYKTYNTTSGATVLGKGNNQYFGAGLLGRFDFVATAMGHAYVQGSVRAGHISNNYHATLGLSASYDTDASYYGMHAGAGYVWAMTPQTSLDIYGKVLLTHQGGDNVTLATGDSIQFDDVISKRVQAGTRVSYELV